MELRFELRGTNELIAWLGRAADGAPSRAGKIVAEFTDRIRQAAYQKLNGPVLARKTGNLQDHLGSTVTSNESGATGTVGVSGVAYARIQEYGGRTSPHVIRPKNASVLAFLSPGKIGISKGGESAMIFARVVNHPGSKMPERSYLRSSLAENRSDFIDALRAGAWPDGNR